jgi:RNA-binding protein YhbY
MNLKSVKISVRIDCEMDEETLLETIEENKKYYNIRTIGFKDHLILIGRRDDIKELALNYFAESEEAAENFINKGMLYVQ